MRSLLTLPLARLAAACQQADAASSQALLQQLTLSRLAHNSAAGSEASSTGRSEPASSASDRMTAGASASRPSSSWQTHTNSRFSIRPSFLSPLYPIYAQQRDLADRRTLLKRLIVAHYQLGREVEAVDEEQAVAHARARATELRDLVDDLFAIRRQENLPRCDSPEQMYGWYARLEELARGAEPEHEAFFEVQQGRGDVFEYWARNFVQQYANTPSLEPLEAIYARPDPRELLQRLSRQAQQIAAAQQSSASDGGGASSQAAQKVDVEGAAHAKGSRKTARARVRLSPGVGRILVNGKPFDLYFPDIYMRFRLVRPFFLSKAMNKYDVVAEVAGGGHGGQAAALGQAIARALVMQNPLLAPALAEVTKPDVRQKERKKIQKHGARTSRPWVKR